MLSRQQHSESGNVEQRQNAEVHVIGRQRPMMQELHAGGDEVRMGEKRAARPAADRRGMNHDKAGIRIGVRRGNGLREAPDSNNAE